MKPPPWKCASCGQRSLVPETLDYPVELEHDGLRYSFVVPALQVSRCQQCGSIVLGDEANAAITAALRREAGLLAPADIQTQRAASGLTQAQLAELLQVPEWTVTRLESGGQVQTRALDRLMRIVFDFPEVRRRFVGTNGPAAPVAVAESPNGAGVGK